MLSDQEALRAGAGAFKSDYIAADNVQKHHAGANTVALGAISALSAGGGGVINCLSVAHARTTGEKLAVQIKREKGRGQGLGVIYTITKVDNDNFTLDSTTFTGAEAPTGTWELVETTTEKWYPGVDSWAFVLARGAAVTFGVGNLLADQDVGQIRPGDPPQNGEAIPSGAFWAEGLLGTFIMQTGGGAARLIRT